VDTTDSITELYREQTPLNEPSDELVAELLALLDPDEAVLFTCGWADMSEKWGPLAQLTVTTLRIVDQRWAGPRQSAVARTIDLRDVRAVADRPRGETALFQTHALVSRSPMAAPRNGSIRPITRSSRRRPRSTPRSPSSPETRFDQRAIRGRASLDERRCDGLRPGRTLNSSPPTSSSVAGGDTGARVLIAKRCRCNAEGNGRDRPSSRFRPALTSPC